MSDSIQKQWNYLCRREPMEPLLVASRKKLQLQSYFFFYNFQRVLPAQSDNLSAIKWRQSNLGWTYVTMTNGPFIQCGPCLSFLGRHGTTYLSTAHGVKLGDAAVLLTWLKFRQPHVSIKAASVACTRKPTFSPTTFPLTTQCSTLWNITEE